MSFLGHYLLIGVLFVIIDSFWLAVVANKFYKSQMGNLLLDKPNFIPAVIFYLIYMLGITVFVVNPALKTDNWQFIWHGILLGLAMYATYDLTNASTLKGWPIKVTIVDLVWGTFITTLVSIIAVAILR